MNIFDYLNKYYCLAAKQVRFIQTTWMAAINTTSPRWNCGFAASSNVWLNKIPKCNLFIHLSISQSLQI